MFHSRRCSSVSGSASSRRCFRRERLAQLALRGVERRLERDHRVAPYCAVAKPSSSSLVRMASSVCTRAEPARRSSSDERDGLQFALRGRRPGRGLLLAGAARADEHEDDNADDDDSDEEHPEEDRTAASAAHRVAEPGRGGDTGSRPVVRVQLRLDVVLLDVVELVGADRPVVVAGEVVGAAVGRDGEQVVALAETVPRGRLVGPVGGLGRIGEGGDVDDVEVDAVVVVQLLRGVRDAGLVGTAQHVRLVDDVARSEIHRILRGGGSSGEHARSGDESQRQQGPGQQTSHGACTHSLGPS